MGQEQLINGCKNGDRKAQRDLYDRYANTLFACCLKYAPSYQEAQDILQDSFITIFKKVGQYNHKGSFEGWCKRIAITTALQRYRSTAVYPLENNHQVEEVELTELEEQSIGLQDLLAMVQQLPDQYRMVFSMYVLDGYSHKEIAKMMKISTGTSKSNLSRARLKLQEMINSWRIANTSDAS